MLLHCRLFHWKEVSLSRATCSTCTAPPYCPMNKHKKWKCTVKIFGVSSAPLLPVTLSVLLHWSLEPALNIAQTHAHYYRATVWTGHRIPCLHKLIDQPLHLLRCQRHVHLDCGFACKLGRNPVSNPIQRRAAPLALDYHQHFPNHADQLRRGQARWRGLYRDCPA